MRKLTSISAVAAIGLLASSSAFALQCVDTGEGYTRTFNLSPATNCGTGNGNPDSADIEALFGSGTYVKDITGFSAPFVADAKSGSGTWSFSTNPWLTYGEVVITIHVGGGKDELDDFGAFVITPKSVTGSWSYSQVPTEGGGGGLSNIKAWGRGPALCQPGEDCGPPDENVPEPGTLALLGLGLLGLGASRRRVK